MQRGRERGPVQHPGRARRQIGCSMRCVIKTNTRQTSPRGRRGRHRPAPPAGGREAGAGQSLTLRTTAEVTPRRLIYRCETVCAQAAREGTSERQVPSASGSGQQPPSAVWGRSRLRGDSSAPPECISSSQPNSLGALVSCRRVDIEKNKKDEGPRHLADKMSSAELFCFCCSCQPSRSEQLSTGGVATPAGLGGQPHLRHR